MPTWSDIQDAIRSEVAAMVAPLGMHDKAVFWRDSAQFIAGSVVKLNLLASVDEVPPRVVRAENVDGDFDESVSSLVRYTVTIRAESLSHETTKHAQSVLQQIRSALSLPVHREALIAAGAIPIGEPLGTAQHEESSDERLLSVHQMDQTFRSEIHYAPAGDGRSTIEHVTGEGELISEDAGPELTLDVQR